MKILFRTLALLARLLAGVVIVAFLIGYAAPYLSPTYYWWTDLFAVLLPSLSLAVSVIGLGLLLYGTYRRRWGRVLLAGSLLGLVLFRFGPRVSLQFGTVNTAEEMRLMTFNVPPEAPQEPTSGTPLLNLVQEQAPDVLGLQESWMTSAQSPRLGIQEVSPSLRQLTTESIDYRPPAVLPPGTRIYQPVFGRVALDSLRVYRSSLGSDDELSFQYTRVKFEWEAQPAVLYNVHLETIGEVRPWTLDKEDWFSISRWLAFLESYRESALRRATQARIVRERIEREKHPVIVIGDFNSTPHQWAYRHVAEGLRDAVREGGWGPSATFPAHRPLVQIDHVLVPPAWQVMRSEVPEVRNFESVSDHRPLVVDLRWSN